MSPAPGALHSATAYTVNARPRATIALKKPASESPFALDKHLVEAGLLCKKRLYLDANAPADVELSASRRAMAEVGKQLVTIAQSVFPKGISIQGDSIEEAAAATARHLAEEAPVLFGATFLAEGIEVVADILVRHKDGDIDLYEVKSGTKVKQRYLIDLALQAHVVAAAGHELRAAFLLNLNPKYEHKEGTDFPPMQLLRSTDVTAKVAKQLPHLRARLDGLRAAASDASVLELPMGTYCIEPMRCQHYATCSKKAPKLPAYELPDLNREQELSLRKDGTLDITDVDPKRAGLTFAQRRMVEAIQGGKLIVEPFVREELRQCQYPLHFVAIAAMTEALPRFDGQRPWRRVPYAWAVHTLHEDGRVESASFAHCERSDPRHEFAISLGQRLGTSGTVLCWNSDRVNSLKSLLEDLPSTKGPIRAVISRAQADLMQLFEAGVFHPAIRNHRDLATTAEALLDDDSGTKAAMRNEDDLRALLEKAWTPRVRTATRAKIATQITAGLSWQSDRLLALFRKFAEVESEERTAAAD